MRRLAVRPPKAPDEGIGKVRVDDAFVRGEIGGDDRLALALEVVGRGGDDDARVAKLSGDQARIRGLADAHGCVESLVDQIDDAV